MESGTGWEPEFAGKAWAGHIGDRARKDEDSWRGVDRDGSGAEVGSFQAAVVEPAGEDELKHQKSRSSGPSRNLWGAHVEGSAA